MQFVYYSHADGMYSHVTNISFVCHSFVLLYHLYVFVCHLYVTRMLPVCHSDVLACNGMSLVCGFTMNRNILFSAMKSRNFAVYLISLTKCKSKPP